MRLIAVIAMTLVVTVSSLVTRTPEPSYAAINEQMNFQARLLTDEGALVDDGNYNVQFNIYSGGDGDPSTADETLEWTGTHLNGNGDGVRVANGYLTVQLGSSTSQVNTMADVDWDNDTLWLSINIGDTGSATTCATEVNFNTNCGGDGEMDPFMRLSSTPYAFNAGRLGGRTAGEFVQLDPGATPQAVNSANTAIAVNQTGAGDILQLQGGGNDVLTLTTGGQLSLGNSSTSGTLVVNDGTSHTGTLQLANFDGNYTITIPNPGANDTICLEILANCGSGGGGSLFTDGGTFVYPTNDEGIVLGGTTTGGADIWLQAVGAAVFNQQQNDADFRIAGQTAANLFFVDASTDQIGIGTNTPSATVDIQTAASETGLFIQGSASQSANLLQIQDDSANDLFVVDEAGKVIIGTPDSTGQLLVVDVKNTSGDPAGQDGAIYYNASMGKFRCYESGAWKNCISVSGGGNELIQEITLNGDASQVDFNDIPQDYASVYVEVIARSTNMDGNAPNAVNMQFGSNGSIDSGTNYDYLSFVWDDFGSELSSDAHNSSSINIGRTTIPESGGTGADANERGYVRADIPNYTDTSAWKIVRSEYGTAGSSSYSGASRLGMATGSWRSTNAVDVIRLLSDGDDFEAGSIFRLWGVGGDYRFGSTGAGTDIYKTSPADKPPNSPHEDDDEFDDGALHNDWYEVTGSATYTEENGKLRVDSAVASTSILARPATPDFTFTTKMAMSSPSSNFKLGGIGVRNSSTGDLLEFGFIYNSGWRLNVDRRTNGSFNSRPYNVAGYDPNGPAYLRAEVESGTIYFYISGDGIAWGGPVYSEAVSNWVGTVDEVILYGEGATNVVTYDWTRFDWEPDYQVGGGAAGTSGAIFMSPIDVPKTTIDTPDDEFNFNTLDNKWTVVNGTEDTVDFLETGNVSKYDLQTRPGSLLLQTGSNGSQAVDLRQDYTLADGNSIVVAADVAEVFDDESANNGGIAGNDQRFGLFLNSDDDAGSTTSTAGAVHLWLAETDNDEISVNFVVMDTGGTFVEFTETFKELRGKVYGRVTRDGNNYYGFVSINGGRSWVSLGGGSPSATPLNNVWIGSSNEAVSASPVPIHAIDWIRLGGNNLDPWPINWRAGASSFGVTLQGAYDNDLQGAADITTTDGKNLLFNMADTTTDADFIIDLQGADNEFLVQDNGTNILVVTPDSVTIEEALTVNATSTFNENITVAATKTLTLTGGTTAQRPGSPTEGMLYFDTDTDSLLVYANGKWQADRAESIIVAANDSSQAEKDSADYVADGTDDQVEINAALTAAAGGKVYLLPGTYVTHQTDSGDATIFIPNNTTLAGAGRGTLIELGDMDATDNLIENTDQTTGTGVVIRALRLDGRSDLNTAGTQRGIALNNMGDGSGTAAVQGTTITDVTLSRFRNEAVYLDSSNNNVLTNIVARDNSSGLVINNSHHNVINNNLVQGNLTGIAARSGSNNNTITGNNSQGNGVYGIQLNGSPNNTITGNNVEGSDSGIRIGNSSYVVIAGNQINNNNYGAYFDSSSDNTLTGNNLYDNAFSGTTLSGSNGIVVSGNAFQNNGNTTTNNAIYLTSADDNTITGNSITDDSCSSNCHAINISNSTSDNNYLANNNLGSNGTINDAGTGTIYGGQNDDSDDYIIQPAGDINLLANTNVTSGILTVSGDQSAGAWGTDGLQLRVASATLTDSTSSGTVTSVVANSFGTPTFAADSTTTYTDAATVYIQGAPNAGTNATLTNTYALWVDDGDVRFDGDLEVAGTLNTNLTQGSVAFAGANGQLSQDNANFFWDDTNNRLGIGTNTVDNKLHLSFQTAGSTEGLKIENTEPGGHGGSIRFYGTESGVGGNTLESARIQVQSAGSWSQGDNNRDSRMVFSTTDGGVLSEAMRIAANGFVGIRTGADPDAELHVSGGSGGATLFKLERPTVRSLSFNISNTETGIRHAGAGGIIGIRAAPSGDNQLTILESGNVGIGDISPATLLTVGDGDLFQVNSSGAIQAATGITSSGTITFSGLDCTANANGGALTANASGVISCSDDDGGGSAPTLQVAYDNSTGGTTPEIKVDSTRGAVDIQDADTTIAGQLLSVRASNAAGLGQLMFGVDSSGHVTFQNSADSEDGLLILDADGGIPILRVDTLRERVAINGGTNPGIAVNNNAQFTIYGSDPATSALLVKPSGGASFDGSRPAFAIRGGNTTNQFAVGGGDVYVAINQDSSNVTDRLLEVNSASGSSGDILRIQGDGGVEIGPSGLFKLRTEGTATSGSPQNSQDLILQGSAWDTDGATAVDRTITQRLITSDSNDADYRLGFLNDDGTEFVTFDGFNERVGVGVTNPSQALTLSSTGQIGWDDGTGNADIRLYRESANVLRVASETGEPAVLRIEGSQSSSTQANSGISLYGAASGSTDVHIRAYRGDPSRIFGSNGSGGGFSGNLFIDAGTTEANTLVLQGKNTSNLANVSIGADDSSAKLYVNQTSTNTTADTLRGLRVVQADTGAVSTGTDTTYGQLIDVTRTGATGGTVNNYGLDINLVGDTGGTSTNYGLNINVSGADTNYSAIFQGGNVGIGTSTPSEALNVAGNIAIQDSDDIYLNTAKTASINSDGSNIFISPEAGSRTILEGNASGVLSPFVIRNTDTGSTAGAGYLIAAGGLSDYIAGYGAERVDASTNARFFLRLLSNGSFTGQSDSPLIVTGGATPQIELNGDLLVSTLDCTSNANGGALTANASGQIICSDDDGGGAAPTLQVAYDNSTGGTTPEIKVDSTRGAVDIQDADTTIAGQLLSVRASNAAGLGQLMFGVDSSGYATFQNSTDSTTALQVLDADGGTPVLNVDTTNERVGIGTNSPQETFVVSSPTHLNSLWQNTGDSEHLALSIGSSVTSFKFGAGNDFSISSESYANRGGSDPGDDRLFTILGSNGNVGIGDTSPTALLTVGSGDTFQVNSSGAIQAATGITSSGTITFSGLDCTSNTNGGALTADASGVVSCSDDDGGSGGVSSLNTLTGGLTLQGTTDQITVSDNGTDTITLSLPQDINTISAPTFAGITLNGTLTANGNSVLGDAAGDTLTVNAASTFNESITVAATKTLTLTGGTTAQRPGSPTEGMLYYDTDTNQLLTYANGKWQGDRTTATKIVAAFDSSQTAKDAADYVADGTDDQVEINAALTAAAGGTVYLMEGTYITHQTDNGDATIFVPNSTTLAGAGRGTLIELGDIDAADNLIENTDQATGTGVVIRDLRLDGRDDLNTAGNQTGIHLSNMGDGTGASAVTGANITRVAIEDFRHEGIYIESSNNNTVTNSSIINSGSNGIRIDNASLYNTVLGNNVSGSGASGISIDNDSNYNTVNGNVFGGNTNYGINFLNGDSNTITGNVISNNNAGGINLFSADNNNVSGNGVHDNGDSTDNNGVHLQAFNTSTRNNIVGNMITDSSCTNTCYAINIDSTLHNNNYLADNNLGANGTINDQGTGTIYGGQVDDSGDYLLQPAGNIELLANANITGDLTVDGDTTLNGTLTVQNTSDSTTAYQFLDADGGAPVLNVDTENERVGIGNDSPSTMLHVGDTSTGSTFRLSGLTGTSWGYNFSTTEDNYLKINSLESGSDPIYIDDDGDFGIGVVPNAYRFQIANPGSSAHLAIGTNPVSGGYTALTYGISAETGGYGFIQATESSGSTYGNLILNRDGGNVGVGGDTTPSALLSVGSTSQFQVNSSGAIQAATGITSSGTITFSGLTSCASLQTDGSGVLSCGSGGSSEWTDTGTLLHPADLSGAEDIAIGGTSTGTADILLQATGAAIFNQQQADADFQISGVTETNLFFADASTDRIGIGINTPGAKLDVQAGSSGDALIVNNGTSTGDILTLQDNGTPVLTVADGGEATFTYTGSSAGGGNALWDFDAGNLGDGTAIRVQASQYNEGSLVHLLADSTDGTEFATATLQRIQSSGTNANDGHQRYGLAVSVLNTGTDSSNFGGTFKAFGADVRNQALEATATGGTTATALVLDAFNGSTNIAQEVVRGTISLRDGDGTYGSVAPNLFFGTGNDATIYYDGTDLILNPAVVGTGVFKVDGDFEVQMAGGSDTLFTADTTNNRLIVGDATGTGSDTTVLVVDSATADPTGVAGAIYYDSSNNKFRCYTTTWVDCDTGGDGITNRMTLYPEYAGGTLYADGTNNSGTMTAGYDSTNEHNYYDWTSSQSTLQDYDIVIHTQVPSDFSSANNTSWNIYALASSTSSANNEISVTVYEGATACNTTDNFLADSDITSANTWTEVNLGSMANCTFNANDTIRIEIKVSAKDSNNVQVGEIRWDYNN